MSNQNTVSLDIEKEEFQSIKDLLLAQNWVEQNDSNQYVVYRLKSHGGTIATMYFSGKLVLQGREDFTKVISMLKEEKVDTSQEFLPHFGVDEVGKGDYFGPLVVVGCFVNGEFFKKVKLLGFADSKKFSDEKIENLYSMVKDYPYYYSSIVYPNEYNRLTKIYRNASLLLAKQHSKVIEEGLRDLESKKISCNYVVIDQFSSSKSRVTNELGQLGKKCKFIQFHKGESDIAVACASIIARGIFVQEWKKMNMKYNFHFPKGASNVIDNAKLFVSVHGEKELDSVAKTSFKTTKQVLE
ncbi:MAG: ribonuclease HIII [Candidatus Dojkabacteria bacterium]|nr:ribonuclease HIII [Candidatus Dojkabacteria bacterium]